MPELATKQKIRKFILSNFKIPSEAGGFADDDSFLSKGLIDSMGVLELLSFVKKEFQVEIKNSEIIPENFDTLNNLTRFIERKIIS